MNDIFTLLLFGGIFILGVAFLDRFTKSKEAQDERGKIIQYQVQSFLFQFTYCGVGVLLALETGGMLTSEQFRNSILYLMLSTFLVGAVYLFWRRKRG
ncbi:hypothetical protein [Paenibacillus xerothermodurans]|uniref:DUF3784 domain-containing protein n=1 Tax=Paenibacillus xerothermodurans TaxID=1977292 RepID=A0A2W1N8Q9_PAEXE|nr:hypothetical protein [Paenibacillus xerothermodurans]PZE20040.1 hypothetical protein CBW46_015275 [Paenibacillus xerothermodurans]